MGWSTRGLRGSSFEEMLNMTNNMYIEKGLAVIQKVPTPITPVKTDNKTGTISLAYFDQRSTVDFIGAVQGFPICFDAKETTRTSLPILNIHAHQIDFMEAFQKQKGIAFLLVNFLKYNEIYFMPFYDLKIHWNNSQTGGRKSIPYEAFEKEYIVYNKHGFLVHYLEAINTYLTKGNFKN